MKNGKKLWHTSFRPLREVILSHLPIIIGIFYLLTSKHELNFDNLLGKGEMVALCIPLILISVMKIYDNKKDSEYGFRFRNTVFVAAIIFYTIAIFYYTVYTYGVFEIDNDKIIIWMSFIFLFVSIISLWVAEFYAPDNLSVEGSRKSDQESLENGFKSLGEG